MSDRSLQALRREALTDPDAALRLSRHLERAGQRQPVMWLFVQRPNRKAHILCPAYAGFRRPSRYLRDAIRDGGDDAIMAYALANIGTGPRPLCGAMNDKPSWRARLEVQASLCKTCEKRMDVPTWRFHVAWGLEIGLPYPDKARDEEVFAALKRMQWDLAQKGIARFYSTPATQ